MADDDDAKARDKRVKDLFKESMRELMEEEKEKARTTPPVKKSSGLFDAIFGS